VPLLLSRHGKRDLPPLAHVTTGSKSRCLGACLDVCLRTDDCVAPNGRDGRNSAVDRRSFQPRVPPQSRLPRPRSLRLLYVDSGHIFVSGRKALSAGPARPAEILARWFRFVRNAQKAVVVDGAADRSNRPEPTIRPELENCSFFTHVDTGD
jgi:hypothetical protein